MMRLSRSPGPGWSRAGHFTGTWPHTGAILAGGTSSRMGRPKHALPMPDGRMMIHWIASTLKQVCRRVLIVGSIDELAELPRLADRHPGLGPLGGIEALLASGIDTQYLVCPCDMPLITPETLGRLARAGDRPAAVLRLQGADRFSPLPARIQSCLLYQVQRQLDAGRSALTAFIEAVEASVVELSPDRAVELTNVNTSSDAARLAALLDELARAPISRP